MSDDILTAEKLAEIERAKDAAIRMANDLYSDWFWGKPLTPSKWIALKRRLDVVSDTALGAKP